MPLDRTQTKKPVEIYREALALLEIGGWIQYVAVSGTRKCLGQAIFEASEGVEYHTTCNKLGLKGHEIIQFNDHPKTTFDDVVKFLEAKIIEFEKEEFDTDDIFS